MKFEIFTRFKIGMIITRGKINLNIIDIYIKNKYFGVCSPNFEKLDLKYKVI